VHGNVYKVPDIPEGTLNSLADGFLVGTEMDEIPPSAQRQARNMTASIFVVQQGEVNVTIDFVAGGNGGGGMEKAVVEAVSNHVVYIEEKGGLLTEVGWRGPNESGSGQDNGSGRLRWVVEAGKYHGA
jgi:hypothetical protein